MTYARAPLRNSAVRVDEATMARRSLRDLFRKKSDKKALSPEMRTLLDSFEAQYGQRAPESASRPTPSATTREPDDAASR